MGTNNAKTKRQSDSSAFARRLGGEEGLKNAIPNIEGYARTIVGDRNLDQCFWPRDTRGDPNHATYCDGHKGLAGIVDQVGQHLMNLVGVGDDLRKVLIEIQLDLDIGGAQLK